MTKPANYPTEPKAIWQKFYEVTQVPRPSKKEDKFIDYLEKTANEAGLKYSIDDAKNVIIYLPATKGYEDHDTVIIQAHMDMVCDKMPNKEFNFEEDPIELLVEDGWVTADQTTLGADNGFGCAAALALIGNDEVQHPPLELLFTSDEETGLNGALGLDASQLTGRKLINTDTDDWGTVVIGCAGGIDYKMNRECEMISGNGDLVDYVLKIGGLKGGHSGIDIHRDRANATKVLSEILWEMQVFDFELAEFSGGTAHNIIPRDAYAVVKVKNEDVSAIRDLCRKKKQQFLEYFQPEDNNLEVSCDESSEKYDSVFAPPEKGRILNLLSQFPHGAKSYNWESVTPLVNLSNNMAIVTAKNGELFIQTSVRYFDKSDTIKLNQQLESIAYIFELNLESGGEYPSWKPVFNNNLLEIVKNEYQERFNEEMKVRAVHAGLECGIIKDKLGEIDAVSLGPTMVSVHSPSEALKIDTVGKFWELFTGVLKSL